MPGPKPTILIIHGGWHVPESYSKLTSALEAEGYEVHIPQLLTMNGARPPNTDLYDDTRMIRGYAESLVRAGRTVVALMHSYGGAVGSGALHGLGLEARAKQGLPGGVSKLIYLTGYATPEGVTMMGKVEEMGNMDLVPLVFDIAEDLTCLHREPKGVMIGWPTEIALAAGGGKGAGDCSEKEVDENIATQQRWNGKGMYQPLKHAAWREISVTYIYATNDTFVPMSYQESFVKGMREAGREVEVFEIPAGHCPNLTHTKEVVEAIDKAVAG